MGDRSSGTATMPCTHLARVLHRRGGPGDADRATVLAREAAEKADDLAMPIVGRWARDILAHGVETPGA